MACGAGALAGLVGRCPAIESLRCEIRKIGPSDSRVHVFGETGTGKERVARALHELSPRASRSFVPLNAAAIGDDLLPSELFGCAKGAYTGAGVARDGYIAAAEGGTLFIDEVAELTPLAQARLLRFLQEGEYQRLGETFVRKADVRVVSATNVDLPRRVAEGRFRQDLLVQAEGPLPGRAAAARAGQRRAAARPALPRSGGEDGRRRDAPALERGRGGAAGVRVARQRARARARDAAPRRARPGYGGRRARTLGRHRPGAAVRAGR